MEYADDRYHLRVEIQGKGCKLSEEELVRMQRTLESLGQAVQDFAGTALTINVIHHPRGDTYHVEARLKLPGRTLFSGDEDTHLEPAFQRCVRKLVQKVETYKLKPDRGAEERARRLAELERDIVAPEDPADGRLGRAVQDGDYRAFRTALNGYEDWLARRVGRWVQRYPDAEARIGDGLLLGDLVEEVYLNAFEGYTQRPAAVAFHDWLNGLIDPSLKLLLKHADEEKENVSMARTLREMPVK